MKARSWTDSISWTERLPTGWCKTRVGRVTSLHDQRNVGHDDRLLSLSAYTGIRLKHYDDDNRVRSGEDLAHYWQVEAKHLVVNPMWLNNGSIAVSTRSGVISPDYRVYNLRDDVLPKFAHFVFRSPVYWSLYQVLTRGHTTYDRRISKDDFASLPFPIPPLPTQRAIADFLDRKTAAIDALIEKKERLLALLAEKRAALIHRAVTKGLDPDVPMKDSGVPWIGEIPAHWEVGRLRWTRGAMKGGTWGSNPDGSNDLICVRVADFDREAGRVVLQEPTLRSVSLSERRGRLLATGDLLLEKSGGGEKQPVGAVVLYDHPHQAVCSNFVARVKLAPSMDSHFLLHLHRTMYETRINVRSIKQTTGIQNLDTSSYFDEPVAIPPNDEQRAIAQECEAVRMYWFSVNRTRG